MPWKNRWLAGLLLLVATLLPSVIQAAGNNPQDLEAVRKAFSEIQKKQKQPSVPSGPASRHVEASGSPSRLSGSKDGGVILYYRLLSKKRDPYGGYLPRAFRSDLSKLPNRFASGRDSDVENLTNRDFRLYDASQVSLAELEAKRDMAIQEAISQALGASVKVEALDVTTEAVNVKSLDKAIQKRLAEMPLLPKRRLKLVVAVLDNYTVAHPGTFETGFMAPPKYSGAISLAYNTEIRLYDPASGGLLDKAKLSVSSSESAPFNAEWAFGYGFGKKDTDPRPEMMPALIQALAPKMDAIYRQVSWRDYLVAVTEMAGKGQ